MKKINIGILGLGNVAIGTIKILRENHEYISKQCGADIVVKKVLVTSIDKERDIDIDKSILTTNADDILLDDDISIVLELIGGLNPAYDYIKTALERKKHVVSANKLCISEHINEFFKISHENNVMFKFEASVAGGIPIINGINQSLTANKIESIIGIINGTTNFVLTKMTNEGKEFSDVLKEAQSLGFAEADPTSDIENHDATYKLKILSKLAFGFDAKDIYTEGITSITKVDIDYAHNLGYVFKSLAVAKVKDDKIELKVTPCMIKKRHPLANVSDSFNAVFINGNAVGEVMFYGRGAGSLPTGSAVVSDLISIVSNSLNGINEQNIIVDRSLEKVPFDEITSKFYIRLSVKDKPGVLAYITGSLSKNGISVKSIIQKEEEKDIVNALVIFTDKITYGQLNEFIADIKTFDKVEEVKNIFSVL